VFCGERAEGDNKVADTEMMVCVITPKFIITDRFGSRGMIMLGAGRILLRFVRIGNLSNGPAAILLERRTEAEQAIAEYIRMNP
jgi:hypothetical protein